MITGYDVWKWTGYCFVDTYFDEGLDARETVETYDEDAHEDEGMEADPFTLGSQEAKISFSDPRGYFLEVLRIRSSQLTREWENVVSVLESSVRHFNDNQVCHCQNNTSQHLLYTYPSRITSSFIQRDDVSRITIALILSHCRIASAHYRIPTSFQPNDSKRPKEKPAYPVTGLFESGDSRGRCCLSFPKPWMLTRTSFLDMATISIDQTDRMTRYRAYKPL